MQKFFNGISKFYINNFNNINKRYYSTFHLQTNKHSKVVIIGAGTGGMVVSSQLKNQSVVSSKDITIFDPSRIHYYQPGFTKIGGGVIESESIIKRYVTYNMKDLTEPYNFQNVGIKLIDPNNNTLIDENCDKWTYDNLVIACGIELKMDSIPGNDLINIKNRTKFIDVAS